MTTDESIVKYNSLGYKVIGLNFVNEKLPGGGYLRGSIAQEEDLCRQYPFLYNSLKNSKYSKDDYYPIDDHVLLTYDVKRYREDSNLGYKIIENSTIETIFITSAAPNMRMKRKDFQWYER